MSSPEKAELQCRLCPLRSNNLNSHITRVHGMTIAVYKEAFPGAVTCRLTPAQIEKMRVTKAGQETANKRHQREIAARRTEAMNAGPPLQCMLCAFTSHGSLITHITRKHSVTMPEYRSRFPDALVQRMNSGQRQKISSQMKAKLEDPAAREAFMAWRSFPSEAKHWIRKGLTLKEAQQKVKEHQQQASAAQDNPATKTKQSVRTKGAANPMSLTSIAARHGVTIKEARGLTPCYGRKGVLHPMHGKKHTEAALRLIGLNLTRSNVSEPEQALAAAVAAVFPCERNVPVAGWSCDVVAKERKLIIEFFGDFWHHNPARYSVDYVNPMTKRTSQFVWDRDARKLNELKALGYDVVVVWEADWRTDEAAQLQRIKDAYDRAQ